VLEALNFEAAAKEPLLFITPSSRHRRARGLRDHGRTPSSFGEVSCHLGHGMLQYR